MKRSELHLRVDDRVVLRCGMERKVSEVTLLYDREYPVYVGGAWLTDKGTFLTTGVPHNSDIISVNGQVIDE